MESSKVVVILLVVAILISTISIAINLAMTGGLDVLPQGGTNYIFKENTDRADDLGGGDIRLSVVSRNG